MKRSRHVGLLAASVSLMALAGCYEEEAKAPVIPPPAVQVASVAHEDKIFESLEACLADIEAEKAPQALSYGDAAVMPAAENPADKARLACVSDWEKAKAEHEKSAPRFATLAECQAEFGPEGCGAAPAPAAAAASSGGGGGGGGSFMPFMMGYMVGNMMSPSYPVYHDRSGGYRSYGSDSSRDRRLSGTSAFVSRSGTTSSLRNSTALSRPSSGLTSTRSLSPTPSATAKSTAPKATGATSSASRRSGFGFGRSSTSGRSSFGG